MLLRSQNQQNPKQNTSKFKMKIWAFTVFSLLLSLLLGGSAEQCGSQAGGAVCPGGLCCSQFGWCGSTNDYCGTGCQSQCGGAGAGDLGSIISSAKFDEMLKHRNDGGCPGKGFYTYNAFISAANAFSGFGTTGDADTRKREIATFLGQTSHETTGSFNQSQT
jgi:chitinase